MIVFITGGAKNGKSSYAQDLAVKLASGGKHYYLATMIPCDEEDNDPHPPPYCGPGRFGL